MGSQGIPGDWRTKREFGGGMLLDWGIHLTDQLLWMVPGRLNRIYCKLGHILGGECDDSVKPVSYTHLDVYKRQPFPNSRQLPPH